jgi:IclR family transcriptional regulator, pca regulon regulatory protein
MGMISARVFILGLLKDRVLSLPKDPHAELVEARRTSVPLTTAQQMGHLVSASNHQSGKPETPDREIMGGFLKGLSVIEAFDRDQSQLTIADVAKSTGLDRAAARRCLLTLVRLGYATTDGKRFELTARILRLGYAYLAATPLPRLIQPYLERLSEQTQESCSVSVLDGTEIVYIARAAQRRVLSIGLGVGSRLPAYCASMGRVMLAHSDETEARRILIGTERRKLTPNTLTDPDELMHALELIRKQGHCVVDQELEIGLRSIAVPLLNVQGRCVAAMNVGAQAARVSCEQMREAFLPLLLAVQAEISRLLT